MTANQLAYQANLEAQRANRAREAENYRSNKAKENETYRSNLARELETNRANLSSEQLKQYEIEAKNLLTSKIAQLLDVDTKQDLADLLGIPLPESGTVSSASDYRTRKGAERAMHIGRVVGSIFG